VTDRLISSEVRRARDRLSQLGRWYASRPGDTPADELDDLVAADHELERVARTARIDLVADVDRRAGPFDGRMLAALLDVPRERFVRPNDIAESTIDTPLLLDEEGLATISAPHAYLLSFRVLELKPGDRIAELGTGSGYGAALASHVVAPQGSVFSIEIDRDLASRAARLLRDYENVTVVAGDAADLVSDWRGYSRITVTFAVDELPVSWLDAIPEGGRMVAPVGRENAQRLLRIDRQGGELSWSDHGAVRYVRNRGPRADVARS
jgi:protein-L-isoaspartate(D-aspartate) O-methyltransferase